MSVVRIIWLYPNMPYRRKSANGDLGQHFDCLKYTAREMTIDTKVLS
jgi:hypothetical protein